MIEFDGIFYFDEGEQRILDEIKQAGWDLSKTKRTFDDYIKLFEAYNEQQKKQNKLAKQQ